MTGLSTLFRRYRAARGGNIAITTALTAPLVILSLGLGVDFGAMALQKRQAQNAADLAAIVAAARPSDAEEIVAEHFLANNLNILVRRSDGLLTPRGDLLALDSRTQPLYDGIAVVERGRYVADPTAAVGQRFVADATPADAVRVVIEEPAKTYFSGLFASAPSLAVRGTASAQKYAAFSLGSRLASVQDGLANAILGGLLGTKITLKAMDYRALADLDVNLLKTMDTLATDLKLTALTYDELLKTDITYGQLLTALGKTTGITPNVQAILNTLGKSLGKTALKLRLERLAHLGSIGNNLVGSNDNLSVTASVLELVNAAAVAANGGNQIAVDLGAGIPGLAEVKLKVAIGEPMVDTPAIRVGGVNSMVRTAQTRLTLDTSINGLAILAGLKIHVPLYIEVASAEARLADIRCTGHGSADATVAVDVVPAVAEVALGDVNPNAFQNFSSTPRVTETRIVDSLLLKIWAKAHVTAGNLQPTRMSFSASEIAAHQLKTVSTRNTLTSLVTTLLKNLDLRIDLLGLPLATNANVQSALASALAPVTAPIDELLYNTLLLLGVRVGEADVRVSAVRCSNPVLVQ